MLRPVGATQFDLRYARKLKDTLSDLVLAEVIALCRSVFKSGQPQLKRLSEKNFAWSVPLLNDPTPGVALELVGTDPDHFAELVNLSSLWCEDMREVAHEAMDGSGCPNGLKGEEIPLSARIPAVADSYDVITSNRPYRHGMPTDKAEAILRGGSGNQWDPQFFDAFFRTVNGIYLLASQRSSTCLPTGSEVSQTDSLELHQACVTG